MGRASKADGWCILTTAGPRTLPLARALTVAGLRAWTPTRTVSKMGRGKKRKEVVKSVEAITPTFVFVGAEHVPALLVARTDPMNPYPAFRIMRERDDIPVIAEASLTSLRAIEERFARSALKATRNRIETGTRIRIKSGAWAGCRGVVERGGDREAKVDLGGGFSVKIASYLFGTDVVRDEDSPAMGLAA